MSGDPGRVNRARFDALLDDMEEAQNLYRGVRSEAVTTLHALGIEPRRKPKVGRPRLQGPVSQMTDAELGDVQGEFSVWEDFLGEQFSEYKLQAVLIKKERDYVLARLKDKATGPQAGKADKAKSDLRYIRLDAEFELASAVADRIQRAHDGLKTQRKVCSRYVELRTREIDGNQRTGSVQNRRRGAPRFRNRSE